MEIFLIRHTKPAIAAGICYGQTDIDLAESFREEAEIIAKYLPGNIQHVISSPLLRCRRLAEWLFPRSSIEFNNNLKEIDCGDWEMNEWDEIPKEVLDPWMREFATSPFPNGESYDKFYQRIIIEFEHIIHNYRATVAIVSHGGVMRSILSYISHTPLQNSFDCFKIPFGTVVEIIKYETNWKHKFLI